MASQPPARSWFRLASIARMEAAEAAAAAAAARAAATPPTPLLPRTPIPVPQQQPTFPPPPPPQQQSTSPPQPTTVQPPPPPPPPPTPRAEPQPELPVTPTPRPEIKTQAPTTITEAAASSPSPKEPQRPHTPVSTPPESPKVINPSNSSPPPSPIAKQTKTTPIQPPPNPEPEPEPEPELETKRPPPPLPQTFSTTPEEKTITNSNRSKANNVPYNKQKVSPEKEEKLLRVITMAGDNTGAVMDIGSAPPRRLGHHLHHTDGNGHGRKMEQEQMDGKKGGKTATKTKHMEAVVNSNVQGINNSIVLNSSTTQHSPGVHITFASNRKPKGGASSSRDKEHHSDHLH